MGSIFSSEPRSFAKPRTSGSSDVIRGVSRPEDGPAPAGIARMESIK